MFVPLILLALWTQRVDSSATSSFTLKSASVEKMFVKMVNIAESQTTISRLSHLDFEALKQLFVALEGIFVLYL